MDEMKDKDLLIGTGELLYNALINALSPMFDHREVEIEENKDELRVEAYLDYGTHGYDYSYVYCEELYCPNCGTKNVWIEDDVADYYEGLTHLCIHCSATFTMPSFNVHEDESGYAKVADEIRSKIK